MFHHTETAQKLPGKLLLERQVKQGEGLALGRPCWGRLSISCRSSIGKEIDHREPHGLHNAYHRTPGEALEQDLSVLPQTDAQAGYAITVRGATGCPTTP